MTSDEDCALWRIVDEQGGLIALQPTEDRPTLQDGIQDCVETLSPVGQPANLSTYWIDRMLANIEDGRSEVAHGNRWVFTLRDNVLELQMDVDPPDSDPLDTVTVSEMRAGLEMLRNEATTGVANRHQLDNRTWIQRNP